MDYLVLNTVFVYFVFRSNSHQPFNWPSAIQGCALLLQGLQLQVNEGMAAIWIILARMITSILLSVNLIVKIHLAGLKDMCPKITEAEPDVQVV